MKPATGRVAEALLPLPGAGDRWPTSQRAFRGVSNIDRTRRRSSNRILGLPFLAFRAETGRKGRNEAKTACGLILKLRFKMLDVDYTIV